MPLCADYSSADEQREIALKAPDDRTHDNTGNKTARGGHKTTKEAFTEDPEKENPYEQIMYTQDETEPPKKDNDNESLGRAQDNQGSACKKNLIRKNKLNKL